MINALDAKLLTQNAKTKGITSWRNTVLARIEKAAMGSQSQITLNTAEYFTDDDVEFFERLGFIVDQGGPQYYVMSQNGYLSRITREERNKLATSQGLHFQINTGSISW